MIKNTRIEPIEKATLRSWDEWIMFMNSVDAEKLDHHEIATLVLKELDGKIDSSGWWAQSVTVAFEQHIGRRQPGQQADGTFQASVSRATKLEMKVLMDKWISFTREDPAVQAEIDGEVRTGGTENRLRWNTKLIDGSTIIVLSEPKKNDTASLVVQLTGLPSAELNQKAKDKWTQILERFLGELN